LSSYTPNCDNNKFNQMIEITRQSNSNMGVGIMVWVLILLDQIVEKLNPKSNDIPL